LSTPIISPVDQQRRRARRTAIVLMLVAAVIYGGFIYLSVHRSHG
jgi:predicted nucleic acid-binding Zn ribbon protein